VDLNPQISIPLPHIPALHKLNTKHPNYKWKALHGTHFMQAKKKTRWGRAFGMMWLLLVILAFTPRHLQLKICAHSVG
jgi:hypothetical protein